MVEANSDTTVFNGTAINLFQLISRRKQDPFKNAFQDWECWEGGSPDYERSHREKKLKNSSLNIRYVKEWARERCDV